RGMRCERLGSDPITSTLHSSRRAYARPASFESTTQMRGRASPFWCFMEKSLITPQPCGIPDGRAIPRARSREQSEVRRLVSMAVRTFSRALTRIHRRHHGHSRGSIWDLQSAQEVRYVLLRRRCADAQRRGDLLVGGALRDQAHDFALARRQRESVGGTEPTTAANERREDAARVCVLAIDGTEDRSAKGFRGEDCVYVPDRPCSDRVTRVIVLRTGSDDHGGSSLDEIADELPIHLTIGSHHG